MALTRRKYLLFYKFKRLQFYSIKIVLRFVNTEHHPAFTFIFFIILYAVFTFNKVNQQK